MLSSKFSSTVARDLNLLNLELSIGSTVLKKKYMHVVGLLVLLQSTYGRTAAGIRMLVSGYRYFYKLVHVHL